MRRSLNWFVVSLSLLVFVANQWWAERAAPTFVQPPALRLAEVAGAKPSSPFAWIHEDGTEVYLPAGQGPLRHPADTTAAVYTWTTPALASTVDASMFQ